jgi:hypothetical protein
LPLRPKAQLFFILFFNSVDQIRKQRASLLCASLVQVPSVHSPGNNQLPFAYSLCKGADIRLFDFCDSARPANTALRRIFHCRTVAGVTGVAAVHHSEVHSGWIASWKFVPEHIAIVQPVASNFLAAW